MGKAKTVEGQALGLAKEGKVEDAQELLNRHFLKKIEGWQRDIYGKQRWAEAKEVIAHIVYFPLQVVVTISLLPFYGIVMIIKAMRNNDA